MRISSRLYTSLALICAAVLLLSACNMPVGERGAATQNPGLVQTAAAETVAALQTSIAQVTPPATEVPPTRAPTQALPPTADVRTNTPIPSLTPAGNNSNATAVPTPCDRAEFVDDVTVPDGTIYAPNAQFVKTWRLKNTGTCTWGDNYRLVFASGDAMGAPASANLPGTVKPQQTVDLSVTLTAPKTPKTYQGNFKLQNGSGQTFGLGSKGDKAFWVKIVVGGTPTLTYFAVTRVVVTASPATYNDTCPVNLKLSAAITVSSSGTVTYYWERNDGFTTKKKNVEYDKGDTKTVTETVTVDATFAGSWRIYVDDPNHQYFGPVAVDITCK